MEHTSPQDTSHSSTTSKKVRKHEPKGSRAARRLERDLADKAALSGLVSTFRDVLVEFEHTAVANPVIGVIGGIIAIDLLHRTRLISDLAYVAGLASIGVLEISTAAASIGDAIANDITAIGSIIKPSQTSSSSIANLITPSPNTDARESGKFTSEKQTADQLKIS